MYKSHIWTIVHAKFMSWKLMKFHCFKIQFLCSFFSVSSSLPSNVHRAAAPRVDEARPRVLRFGSRCGSGYRPGGSSPSLHTASCLTRTEPSRTCYSLRIRPARESALSFFLNVSLQAIFNQFSKAYLFCPEYFTLWLGNAVATLPLSVRAASPPLLVCNSEELPDPRHLGCNFSKVKRTCEELVGLQHWGDLTVLIRS